MPRPRFNLRIALMLVTLLCAWLGWQLSLVRERNATLDAVRESRGLIFYHDRSELPLFRQWMGDTGADWIMVPPNVPRDLQARIVKAFPQVQLNVVSQASIEQFRPHHEK